MDNEEQLYIECLATAISQITFPVEPWDDVFVRYLDLYKDRQAIEQELKKEYEGISQESYQNRIDLKTLEEEKDEMINSLKNIVADLDIDDTYEIVFEDYSPSKFKSLFNFYRKKTGQLRGKPAEIYHIRKSDYLVLETAIRKIAEKAVEISFLQKIQDKLKFTERYNPKDRIIKERVADACWGIFKKLDEKNESIKDEQIVMSVLSNYHIEKYEDLPKKEANGKIRAAATQWVRDNKENLQIK
jgi:hypothetical protein